LQDELVRSITLYFFDHRVNQVIESPLLFCLLRCPGNFDLACLLIFFTIGTRFFLDAKTIVDYLF